MASDIWHYLTTQTGAFGPVCAAVLIVGFIVFSLAKFAQWAAPTVRRVQHVLDDFLGEEARPGVPARPGVVAQIGTLNTEFATMKATVEDISREVKPNHGGSMKDKTDKNSRDIVTLTRKVDGMVGDIADIREALGIRRAATEERAEDA